MTYSQSEIKETSDQGFIFVTNMFENNWEYAKVIKVNNSGDFQWELDLDNHYNKTIDITSDGGFILGGSNYPHDSPPSANIIKINSSGNIEWNNLYSSTNSCERIMDGPGTQAVPGSSIAIDDNGFVMTGKCVYDSSEDDNDDGETYSALYVNKIDFNGNILWDKIFRYPQIDVSVFRGNDIEKDSEGNFVIVGSITHWASPGHRGLLIKIDSNGNRIF